MNEYRLRYAVEDKASEVLARLSKSAQLNEEEIKKLAEAVGALDNQLVRTSPALASYGQSFDDIAKYFGLSSDKLVELNRKLTNSSDALEEQTQKLVDARNKLDEFGATEEQQTRIIGTLLSNQYRYNLTLGKQALVLEELAIELQDATLAEQHLNAALEYTARVGGRAEDAIATYTEAVKGDTAALAKLGPVARAAQTNLDQVRDRQARAAETMRIFTVETNRAPDAVDRLNDSWNIGAARAQMFWARLGVLGPVLLSVAGGLAAVGLGLGKVVFDRVNQGLDKYIEKNKQARAFQDFTAKAADANAQELGKSLYKLSADFDAAQASSSSFFDKYLANGAKLLQGTTTYSKAVQDLWGVQLPGLLGSGADLFGQGAVAVTRFTFQLNVLEDITRRLAAPLNNSHNATEVLTQTFNGQKLAVQQLTLSLQTYGGMLDEIARKAQSATPYLDALGGVNSTGSSAELGRGAFRRQGGGAISNRDPYGAAGDVFGLRVVQVFQGRADPARGSVDGIQTLERLVGVLGALATSVDRLAASSGLEDVSGAAGKAQIQVQVRRTSDYNERAGIERDVGATRLREELGIGNIFDATGPQLDAARELRKEVKGLGEDLTDLATGATAQATTGMIRLFAALGTGSIKARDFGAAFVSQWGDLLTTTGQAMVIMGLGAAEIQAGLVNPGALIAIGAGAILAGEAMRGFGTGSGGGGGSSSSASITRDAFRESTDRFLEEQRAERQSIVIYNYIGDEQLDGPVTRAVRRAQRQGFLGSA